MHQVLEYIFHSPYTSLGFDRGIPGNHIRIKNFFIPILLFIILRAIQIPTTYIFITVFLVYLYVTNRYMNIEDEKLSFLNSIIYNDETEPYHNPSYLHLDPKIAEFYYDHKEFIDYNLTAFRQSLENTNNVLQLSWETENKVKYPEQFFENALMHYREALNNWHSIIHRLPSDRISNYKFDDSLVNLRRMLLHHIQVIRKRLQIAYNKYDINIYSKPNTMELESDIKTKEYSPMYSFF